MRIMSLFSGNQLVAYQLSPDIRDTTPPSSRWKMLRNCWSSSEATAGLMQDHNWRWGESPPPKIQQGFASRRKGQHFAAV